MDYHPLAQNIRPATDLKFNVTEIFKDFSINSKSILSKPETGALLKLLALGQSELKEGKCSDAESFLDEMDD